MKRKVTYYTADDGAGKNRKGVFRRVDETDRLLLERWDEELGWLDWPDLLRATGAGGDSEYVVVSLTEAKKLGGAAFRKEIDAE